MSALLSPFTAIPLSGASWSGALLQAIAVALLPLGYLGVVTQVEAGLSGRQGIRLLQPARDLLRALRKGALRRAVSRPRALIAVLAALGAGVLAPLVGPRSPLAFRGDIGVLVGLLALYHQLNRGPNQQGAPRSPLLCILIAAAAIAGTQVGLADIAGSPRWSVTVACAAAVLLALRVIALPDRSDSSDEDGLELDRGVVRYLDGVVAVALAGLLIAVLQPLAAAWPAPLLAWIGVAAAVGVFAARVARPRPAAHALYLGGAALCQSLAVVLHAQAGLE